MKHKNKQAVVVGVFFRDIRIDSVLNDWETQVEKVYKKKVWCLYILKSRVDIVRHAVHGRGHKKIPLEING